MVRFSAGDAALCKPFCAVMMRAQHPPHPHHPSGLCAKSRALHECMGPTTDPAGRCGHLASKRDELVDFSPGDARSPNEADVDLCALHAVRPGERVQSLVLRPVPYAFCCRSVEKAVNFDDLRVPNPNAFLDKEKRRGKSCSVLYSWFKTLSLSLSLKQYSAETVLFFLSSVAPWFHFEALWENRWKMRNECALMRGRALHSLPCDN